MKKDKDIDKGIRIPINSETNLKNFLKNKKYSFIIGESNTIFWLN